MGKRKIKFEEIVIFLILVVFPFGQLLKLNYLFLDLLAAASLSWHLKKEKINLDRINKANGFFVVIIFSLLFSTSIFPTRDIFVGSLYLFRLFAYISLFYLVRKFIKGKGNKTFLINSLVLVSVFTAVFGWIQYFTFPDFRKFFIWRWDKHLYRLSGAFLDPGFIGILLVLGFILSVSLYLQKKRRMYLISSVLLFISTLFTYSRASILALFVSIFLVFVIKRKDVLRPLIMTAALLVLIFFLPRPGGIGVKLERTLSIFSRIDNYGQTIQIWKESLVFGVGFNNLCIAKDTFLEKNNTVSHACSGSDSSILQILATTGIVGFITFLFFIKGIMENMKKDLTGRIFLISLIALFVHSLFVNSLFYPFVLAWMSILYGLASKNDFIE